MMVRRPHISFSGPMPGRCPVRQRGAALIVSLLILIVLTLIGVSAMSTSSLEEKMASNSRDLNLAFQAAESALKDAERFIDNLASVSAFDGSVAGLYPPVSENNPPPDFFSGPVWEQAIVYPGTIDGVASPPRYIIELVGTMGNDDINIGDYSSSSGAGEITTFRITARGTGGSDSAVVYLQSYYGRNI